MGSFDYWGEMIGMFTSLHVSHIMCQVSHITCHMSHVACQVSHKKISTNMELVDEGSDINGAYLVQYLKHYLFLKSTHPVSVTKYLSKNL